MRPILMSSKMKLSVESQKILCCPVCKSKVFFIEDKFKCVNKRCHSIFPIINDIPILINDKSSVFSIDDFTRGLNTTFNLFMFDEKYRKSIWRYVRKYMPSISKNFGADRNYIKFIDLLKDSSNDFSRVLVVGGGIEG